MFDELQPTKHIPKIPIILLHVYILLNLFLKKIYKVQLTAM
jgi:hypothetical protein